MDPSAYDRTGHIEIFAYSVRIAIQHRLYAVPRDLSQICVVDSSSPKVGDVAMAALVGADV